MSSRRLPVVVVLALAATLAPVAAQAQGGTGLGVYRSFATLSTWLSSDLLVQGGLTFGTGTNDFGLLLRGASKFQTRGSTNVMVGAALVISHLDFGQDGTTISTIGPLVGADVPVSDDLSIQLDAYPLALTFNGDTDVSFLEGRLGATWWFR